MKIRQAVFDPERYPEDHEILKTRKQREDIVAEIMDRIINTVNELNIKTPESPGSDEPGFKEWILLESAVANWLDAIIADWLNVRDLDAILNT